MWETFKFTKHFMQQLISHTFRTWQMKLFKNHTIVRDTDWEAHPPSLMTLTWMFSTLPLLWIIHPLAASGCWDNETFTILFKNKNCSISIVPTILHPIPMCVRARRRQGWGGWFSHTNKQFPDSSWVSSNLTQLWHELERASDPTDLGSILQACNTTPPTPRTPPSDANLKSGCHLGFWPTG